MKHLRKKQTVREHIDTLENLIRHGLNENAVITAYDGDKKKQMPITGFLCGEMEVEVCTDEN